MSVIEFPDRSRPWMKPQVDFEEDAAGFVSDSPHAWHLRDGLRSCASPFIRAAIILHGCSAEDVPFLQRIAELLECKT
jgi:hypothetical protein